MLIGHHRREGAIFAFVKFLKQMQWVEPRLLQMTRGKDEKCSAVTDDPATKGLNVSEG